MLLFLCVSLFLTVNVIYFFLKVNHLSYFDCVPFSHCKCCFLEVNHLIYFDCVSLESAVKLSGTNKVKVPICTGHFVFLVQHSRLAFHILSEGINLKKKKKKSKSTNK